MDFVLLGNFAAIYFPKTAIFAHFLEKSQFQYDTIPIYKTLIIKAVSLKIRLLHSSDMYSISYILLMFLNSASYLLLYFSLRQFCEDFAVPQMLKRN